MLKLKGSGTENILIFGTGTFSLCTGIYATINARPA
jgi:hypothetical protein